MPKLFSYGTLQNEKVQIETFGRKPEGNQDYLVGFTTKMIEITDKEVLRKSNQKFHPILEYTGNKNDKVGGMLFEITESELLQADKYEVDDYKRIECKFLSKKSGFVYVKK
jgi:hypothetical protein